MELGAVYPVSWKRVIDGQASESSDSSSDEDEDEDSEHEDRYSFSCWLSFVP